MVVSERKPDWLKIRPPGGENYLAIKGLLRSLKLHTVCEEARCPNVAECWGSGTATVMLMGDICSRSCRFCHVKSGKPSALDPDEPTKVAEAVAKLGLTYVVLTSVNRDELSDGGANHFARTVENIKGLNSRILVEVLVPDFQGDEAAIKRITSSGADVFAHNVETVGRLTPMARDRKASYQQSLHVLKRFKTLAPLVHTKSSLMVGLGETEGEMHQAMDDLRLAGVDILTIGQYLRPSAWHLPVHQFVTPENFEAYERAGLERGFAFVAAGPLVRSSYRAGEKFIENILRGKQRAIH